MAKLRKVLQVIFQTAAGMPLVFLIMSFGEWSSMIFYFIAFLALTIVGLAIGPHYHYDGVFQIDTTSNLRAVICRTTLDADPMFYLEQNREYILLKIEESNNLQSMLYPEDQDISPQIKGGKNNEKQHLQTVQGNRDS